MRLSRKALTLLAGAFFCTSFCPSCTTWEGPRSAEGESPSPAETEASILHPLNVNFNDQIVLLGYEVTPEKELKPGQTCELVWHWKVLKPLEGTWRQFTHVTSDGVRIQQNIDGRGEIRESLPPHRWKAGALVVDKQVFTLSEAFNAPTATIVSGFHDENGRLEILKGPNNGRGGAIGPVLTTGLKPAAKEQK